MAMHKSSNGQGVVDQFGHSATDLGLFLELMESIGGIPHGTSGFFEGLTAFSPTGLYQIIGQTGMSFHLAVEGLITGIGLLFRAHLPPEAKDHLICDGVQGVDVLVQVVGDPLGLEKSSGGLSLCDGRNTPKAESGDQSKKKCVFCV